MHLLGLIADLETAEPVFDEWPAGAAPLGVARVPVDDLRDRVRETLREAGVYCLIHWRSKSRHRSACEISPPGADDPDRLALHGRGHGARRVDLREAERDD